MIGPYLHQTFNREQSHTCIKCDFLKNHLVRSGRDPQWECECTHPNADQLTGGYIGESPETPDWCPEMKKNKEKGNQ